MPKSNGLQAIEKPLAFLPCSIRKHILESLCDLTQYVPVIGIMGKTGAGKSSLCNALFQGEVTPVSNVDSCTRDVLRFRLRNGDHSLMIFDLPGVGESEQRDEEYTALYRRILPELDLLLWVIKADDRALSVDEHFYREVMLAYQHRVLFVANQANKAEPCHQWNTTSNTPSHSEVVY
jgi:small GTP-binding protein